jgi:hypothetical protein
MQKATYTFECEKACRSYRTEGRELWTLTVPAKDIPLTLKYGPNARYAALDNRPAKDMLETLEHEPSSFVFKNNGMMVVAEKIAVEGTSVTLECSEAEADDDSPGHGVLNGGHTYLALTHALTSGEERFARVREDARVMMTVGIGISDDEIWRISRARNTSEKVPLHALRELAGDWSSIKKYLPAASRPLVAFKPNDPDAQDALYDTTDLLRRLALVNNSMFPAQEGAHPIAAYNSIGRLVKQYDRAKFLDVAPLLPDVLQLEEYVVKHWEDARGKGPGKIAVTYAAGVSVEPTTLLSGYHTQITLPGPFVFPVVAAFRVFIRDGKWVQPLPDLWEKYGPKTILTLWETYKEQGKSSAAVFGRARTSWAAACDLTKSAAIQMGLIKID